MHLLHRLRREPIRRRLPQLRRRAGRRAAPPAGDAGQISRVGQARDQGPSRMRLTTVGVDADDTLWHNEPNFRLTQDRFADLLAPFADGEDLRARLVRTEQRNLRLYGYGVKGFTLSMIETAMEVAGEAAAPAIREVLAAGREMLSRPVEPLSRPLEVLARRSH